jgi:hypothetical protein
VNLYFLYENLLFVILATSFFGIVGWAWRNTKPYDLPYPLPDWFKIWFLTIQIGGGVVPLGVLIWSIWQGRLNVVVVLISYFMMLGLQILSESLFLRKFRSTVFVMVPYLYLPYRAWQLYEGIELFKTANEPLWLQNFLLIEIVLWTLNYALDLAQLPRLLHWHTKQ